MKHIHPDNLHFFASSASTWMTTTPERDLHQLLTLMQKEGRIFNLFMVPLSHDEDYAISMYRPVVEGAVWLGSFEPEGEMK